MNTLTYRLNPSLKRAVSLSLFLFFSLVMFGQKETEDTIRKLSVEVDSFATSVESSDNQGEEDVVASSTDTAAIATSTQDKRYFTDIESTTIRSLTDQYQPRKIPKEVVQKAKNDPAFWYANTEIKPEKKKDQKEKEPFVFSKLFQNILWIGAIVAFLIFLGIYLTSSNIKLFRSSSTIDSLDDTEPETDDIFSINYQKEIDKAMAASNFRLATRLMFLRLLRTLSEKQIIEYKQDRTNLDYLTQLRSSHLYNDFFKVTRDYEYSWYGQFNLDRDKFNIIRKDFEAFESKLR